MKIFEYKQLISAVIKEEDLNKMGAEGWEHYLSNWNVHFFKRSVSPAPCENPLETVKNARLNMGVATEQINISDEKKKVKK